MRMTWTSQNIGRLPFFSCGAAAIQSSAQLSVKWKRLYRTHQPEDKMERTSLRIKIVVLASVVLLAGIACKKTEVPPPPPPPPPPPAGAELISLAHGLAQYPGANADATKGYMN